MWGQIALAAFTFVSGAYSADASRKGANLSADADDKASRYSLLTANERIRRLQKEAQLTKYNVLEEAGRNKGKVNTMAKEAIATATTEGGGSGAEVGSGTTRSNLRIMAQDAFLAQLDIEIGANKNIESIQRESKLNSETIWKDAKYQSDQYRDKADATRKTGNNMHTANMLNTIVQTGSIASKAKFKSTPDEPKTKPDYSSIYAKSKYGPQNKPY